MINFFEARWHIFSKDLTKALPLYEKAFEECLYRAGAMQERIINETLAVASSVETPSKPLLKKLKISLINFGYQVPINRDKYTGKSPHYSDVMQDWKVDYYHQKFTSGFCEDNLFMNVKYSKKPTKLAPIIYLLDGDKPDYRCPGRRIKLGHADGGKKIIPQIVWFSQKNEIEIVKKLLKKKVDVNAVSSSGETALSMALEAMNVFQLSPPKAKLFNLIKQYPHKKSTLNIRTNKKKYLPIISAVDTGKPNVVREILKMGANPNQLGSTDEQTALNLTLKYIKLLKSPNLEKELREMLLLNKIDSPEARDSILRHTGGVGLLDKDSEILDTVMQLQVKNIQQHLKLDNLYEIADLLLGFGANPNQENFYPIDGYTPLMLAAECNEYKLFEKMLSKKGDIWKTFTDKGNLKKYNCLDIAECYHSKEVINIIKTA